VVLFACRAGPVSLSPWNTERTRSSAFTFTRVRDVERLSHAWLMERTQGAHVMHRPHASWGWINAGFVHKHVAAKVV